MLRKMGMKERQRELKVRVKVHSWERTEVKKESGTRDEKGEDVQAEDDLLKGDVSRSHYLAVERFLPLLKAS